MGKLPVGIVAVTSLHALGGLDTLNFMSKPFQGPNDVICRGSGNEKCCEEHNACDAEQNPLNKPLPALQDCRVLSQVELAGWPLYFFGNDLFGNAILLELFGVGQGQPPEVVRKLRFRLASWEKLHLQPGRFQ